MRKKRIYLVLLSRLPRQSAHTTGTQRSSALTPFQPFLCVAGTGSNPNSIAMPMLPVVPVSVPPFRIVAIGAVLIFRVPIITTAVLPDNASGRGEQGGKTKQC